MMRKFRQTILLAAVLATGGVTTVIGLLATRVPSDRADPAQVALGHSLYGQHCASCHGAALEGQPDWQTPLPNGRMSAPPHDATGHTWHHSDDELFTITRNGIAAVVSGYQSDMPAFAGVLSDEEIRAVLAFIKSRWPEKERRSGTIRQPERKPGGGEGPIRSQFTPGLPSLCEDPEAWLICGKIFHSHQADQHLAGSWPELDG